jgi:hypothetical protein
MRPEQSLYARSSELSATFPLASARAKNTRQPSCEPTLCGEVLPIYIRPHPTIGATERSPIEPRWVPPELLKQVLPVRRGLPDHPTYIRRMRVPDCPHHDALLLLLRHGQLVVRQSDFIDWYKHKRAKGNWPSQHNKAASRRGRPTKDSERLRNEILARVHHGAWEATDGIPKLRRLLVERGYKPPSCDTLARSIDRLHRLTGEPSLLRKVRRSSADKNR